MDRQEKCECSGTGSDIHVAVGASVKKGVARATAGLRFLCLESPFGTRRQLKRIAPDSVPDIDPMIDNLVEVGLLIDSGDHFEIRGWSHWNSSVNDIELMSTGSVKGNHLRHHVKRGKWGPTCDVCKYGSWRRFSERCYTSRRA